MLCSILGVIWPICIMEHDFNKVFDTDNPLWQEVLAIFAENDTYPKKKMRGRALHHKYPRCFSLHDGEPEDNDPDNLISLPPAQHFMVHYYYYTLAKGIYKSKMVLAFRYMMSTNEDSISELLPERARELSETYEKLSAEATQIIADACHNRSAESRKHQSETMKGRKYTEEHRNNISKGRKGIVFSEEHKQHLREASHKRILTPEQRDRMRTGLGRHWKMTEEQRRKNSERQKGRVFSEETRKKMSIAAKKRVHPPMSEATKQKLSAINKGKPGPIMSEAEKAKRSLKYTGKHWKLIDGKRVWIDVN